MAVSTRKVLVSTLLSLMASLAVQACNQKCQGCDAFGPYWSGQGCGNGSHQAFHKKLPHGTDYKTCCQTCAKDRCCLFWVFHPHTLECSGYANCNRTDDQPTVREWLGDWKKLPKNCPGYEPNPDAEIQYPGMHRPSDKPWGVGNNPPVWQP